MPNPDHGVATFQFYREADKGPGGQANDHLVFAKVTSTGDDDLEFSDNKAIEIQYAATARETDALAAARLVNVQVDILWWVTRNADKKDGTDADGNPHKLGGWKVVMGEGDDATTHATADSADMEVDAEDHGSATFSERLTVAAAIEGKMYSIALDEDVVDPAHDAMQPDMGEDWDQSAALTHSHDHLALPSEDAIDIGALAVTWTTQTLTLGVYREADDVEGFTEFRVPGSDGPNGDHRPNAEVGEDMMVELMTRDSRNRLRTYQWDHDCDDDGEKEMPTDPVDAELDLAGGMASFGCLPADVEFTVRFHPGDDREQMDYGYDEIETFGDDLDFGMTVGAFGDMSGAMPRCGCARLRRSTPPTNGAPPSPTSGRPAGCTARWARRAATKSPSSPRPTVTARSVMTMRPTTMESTASAASRTAYTRLPPNPATTTTRSSGTMK